MGGKRIDVTPEQVELICSLYDQGQSLKEIAAKIHRGTEPVRNCLLDNGRNPKERRGIQRSEKAREALHRPDRAAERSARIAIPPPTIRHFCPDKAVGAEHESISDRLKRLGYCG